MSTQTPNHTIVDLSRNAMRMLQTLREERPLTVIERPTSAAPRARNAPLRRRVVERLLTSWQPLFGPLTQRKDTRLHRWAAYLTPRLAARVMPLLERAEAALQPREYRGWERLHPKEILVRPMFQDLEEVTDLELRVVQGAIPEGLRGHVFWQTFSHEVSHELRFMGRSMLLRLDVGQPGTLRLTSRKLVTPSQVFKEHARGTPDAFRFLRALLWISPTAGYAGDYGQGILTVDDALVITANTVSPMLVDKKTLKIKGPFGRASDYYPTVPFAAPFPPRYSTAHAFYDEITREYFSVNYGYGFTRLVVWSPGWERFRSYLLRDERGKAVNLPQSTHQLMVSRDYVIVLNNDGHLLDFPNPFCQDTVAFVIRRADLTGEGGEVRCKRIPLPMTATHQIANYDNPNGVVTFFTTGTVPFAPDMSGILPNDVSKQSGKYYSDANWGTFPLSQSDMAHIARYTIDAEGGRLLDFKKISDPRLTWDAQYNITRTGMGTRMYQDGPRTLDTFYATFFGFKKSSVMKRMNDIFAVTRHSNYTWDELPEEPVPPAIVAVDTASWTIKDSYSFAVDDQPGHSCNVPTEDGGFYFILPVQNATSDRFFILDPKDLAKGPICILDCPVRLPYVQHPAWAADLETTRVDYPVDLEKDLLVEGMTPGAERIVREHVLPYFAKQG